MYAELLSIVRSRASGRLFIQTHDFPDHDAVASAFALKELLAVSGIMADIVYAGAVQRDSLLRMIDRLGVGLIPAANAGMTSADPVVIVDGCKYNKNVTDLIGDEIAVVDHHQVERPEGVPFCDIRSNLGSCSTLILSYYAEAGVRVSREAATALMIGLSMDTALMTRGVSEEDVTAYAHLFPVADMRLVNSILRNYIQVKEMPFYRSAIDRVSIEQGVACCYFPEGCSQNLLGILGDFFLSFQEIDFVALFASNSGKVNVSMRCEIDSLNAAQVMRLVLEGIGFGGGHADMAGGIIPDAAGFNESFFFSRVREYVRAESKSQQ
jgi:nanoRNase/pAp phosphatase (c-di-AMP/oligoRNAs hydrolase)